MIKKILICFAILLCCNLYAETSDRNRIDDYKEEKISIDLDTSIAQGIYSKNGFNQYTIAPSIGLSCTALKTYTFSIAQSFQFELLDVDKEFKELTDDKSFLARVGSLFLGFDAYVKRDDLRFNLGTHASIPFLTILKKEVQDRGIISFYSRFSFIQDPATVGVKLSYAFSPPIGTQKDWIPCVIRVGGDVAFVLNAHISLFIESELTWNSGVLTEGRYVAGQSFFTEGIAFGVSYGTEDWSLIPTLSLDYSDREWSPSFELKLNRVLYRDRS